MMATFFVLLKMGWRNLLRNKRRTGIMLLILSLGASSLILVGGFLDDLMIHMREDFIHTQNGHIQVSHPGYIDEGSAAPLDYLIDNVSSLQALLGEEKHVTMVVPRLKLLGIASAGGSSIAVQFIGVDPQAETFMSRYRHTNNSDTSVQIVQGHALSEKDSGAVVVGQSLLKNLSMTLGDRINFLTARKEGALDGRDYAVAGSFQTFMKAFDERTIFVPLKDAQRLIGKRDAATHVLLLLDKTEATDAAVAGIRKRLAEAHLNFDVTPWWEQAEYYHQCRSFLDRIFQSVLVLMAAIFVFTVSNMMNLAIQERTREFGTMMAIGNGRPVIFATILMESVILGILGAALGAVLGFSLGELVSWIGIPMPPPPQGSAPYEAVIHFSTPLFAKTALLTTSAGFFGAMLPGWRSSRTPILEALAYV